MTTLSQRGTWLAGAAVLAGAALASLVLAGVGAMLPVSARALALVAGTAATAAAITAVRRGSAGLPDSAGWIAVAVAGSWVFALLALYNISFYLRFPVDFLNFWEGDFLGDIIKLRAGLPIYTEPTDNNSSVYTPGAQLLTYAIGRLAGVETSIPSLRTIQFSFAVLAALVTTSSCDHLARRFLRAEEYAGSALWLALWFPLLFLVATEHRFGYNIHALHPDSLTLFISAVAFWLLCRHLLTAERWIVVAMALVPAIGFWSKQSLLLWGLLFGLYLLTTGPGALRRASLFGALSLLFLAASILLLFQVGGPHTRFWIFGVLGAKSVSLARSINALTTAGAYVALALAGLWLLVLRDRTRQTLGIWGITALLFLTQAYTTGIGWQKNHLGPGVLLAAAWFLAALPRLHRAATRHDGRPPWIGAAALAIGLLMSVAGIGLTREPKSGVPGDTDRYITAIEREFDGMNPRDVLLDRGNWVYFPDTILQRDRASSVQLWVGKNQPTITHEMLTGTIQRFEQRRYRRILVRNLDQGSAYDFQSRGSGVRDALLMNYQEVRRIPGVEVELWWPSLLLADISVLEPRTAPAAPEGSP